MVNRIVLNTVSYHGSGAVKEIGPELSARGFKKALVCSGKHVVKSGEINKILDPMKAAGIDYALFTDIKANPTIENVQNGVQAFKDAGADYFLKNDKRSGGVTLDFETVYNQGDEADYWRIVNSYPGTFSYEALKEQDPRYADFRAFREKGIIYCNMKDTPFYESMPTEPEVVLADLLHIFHPDLLPDHTPVYYARLK